MLGGAAGEERSGAGRGPGRREGSPGTRGEGRRVGARGQGLRGAGGLAETSPPPPATASAFAAFRLFAVF